MFDPTLNATFCPSQVLADSTVAFWRTPSLLGDLIPIQGLSLARPTSSPRATSDTLFLVPHPGEAAPMVECEMFSAVQVLKHWLGEQSIPDASRSVLALGHVARLGQQLSVRSEQGRTEALPSLLDALSLWIPPEALDLTGHRIGLHQSLMLFLQTAIAASLDPTDEYSSGNLTHPATADSSGDHGGAYSPHLTEWTELIATPQMGTEPAVGAEPAGSNPLRPPLGQRDHAQAAADESDLSGQPILQIRVLPPQHSMDVAHLLIFIRDRIHPELCVSALEVWSGVNDLGASTQLHLLTSLVQASRAWTPLVGLLDEPAPSSMRLSPKQVDDFFTGGAHSLIDEGIEVLVPKNLIRSLTLTPRVTTATAQGGGAALAASSSGRFSMSSLCSLNWTVSIDGQELDGEATESLLKSRSRLARHGERWILLDDSMIDRVRSSRVLTAPEAIGQILADHWDTPRGPALELISSDHSVGDTGAAIQSALHNPRSAHVDAQIRRFLRMVRRAAVNESFIPPKRLQADLRSYQRAGVAWMTTLTESGFGGILADDMGLGKTIQVIAAHLWLHDDQASSRDQDGPPDGNGIGPTLVIAPTGLIHNWIKEFKTWAPSVHVRSFHGPERSLDDIGAGDVVVTSYGVVRRDFDILDRLPWGLVIADEAQALKNHTSETATAIRRIRSGTRFALTGTPIENHIGELWSILDWTTPGLLGSAKWFAEFSPQLLAPTPQSRIGDSPRSGRTRLGNMIAPFVLRRLKTDDGVLSDLPPRTVTDHHITLSDEQASLYTAVTSEALASVSKMSGMERRGAILKLITALKQVTNHPAHLLAQNAPLHGRSDKFDLTLDLVEEIVASGQAVIVFTQYVQMGKLLRAGLADLDIRSDFLNGKVPPKQRSAMVADIQEKRSNVLIVSLRAGGTGLNLTAATHVIHYDRWWNPAVENQASDRIWRIGQTLPVQVHRIVAVGTIEERIAELLESKQELADDILGAGATFTELDNDELAELVIFRPDGRTSDRGN